MTDFGVRFIIGALATDEKIEPVSGKDFELGLILKHKSWIDMNQVEKEQVHNFAQVLRTARKLRGYNQVELSEKVGVSQSMLSKLEKALLVPSAPIWFKICDVLKIPAEAGMTGVIDTSEPLQLTDVSEVGNFSIPKDYAFRQGACARVMRPFLEYHTSLYGADKTKQFLKSLKLDPDYFNVLNNPVNINLIMDILKKLFEEGTLNRSNLNEVAELDQKAYLHGAIGREYQQKENIQSLLLSLRDQLCKYTINWEYQFTFQNNTVKIEERPAAHLKEFKSIQKEIGELYFEYRKTYLERFLSTYKVAQSQIHSVRGTYESPDRAFYEVQILN